MKKLRQDQSGRIVSDAEFNRLVEEARAMRAKALNDIARGLWARIRGIRVAVPKAGGGTRHA